MRLRPPVATTLTSAVLVAVAVLPLREVFGDWSWAPAVMGAAFAGAAVASLVESWRRRPPVVVALAAGVLGVLGWTLATVFTARFFAAPLSTGVWGQLRRGVFDGWSALLDEGSPIADPQAGEVFATVLAWSAAALAVHVAARRHTALAGLVAAAATLWVCSAAALPRGLAPTMVGIGAGAVALVVIATLGDHRDDGWRTARVLSLVAMIAGTAVVAAAAAEVTATVAPSPIDPRSRQGERVTEIEVPDLLATFEAERRQEDETLLTVTSPDPPSEIRLRLGVYDTHDGERWRPIDSFDEVTAIPEPAELPPGEAVDLEITEESAYTYPWVPLPDRVVAVGLRDLRWNASTQTALRDPEPATYAVRGTLVGRELALGRTVAVGDSDAFLELPDGLPRTIVEAAEQAATEGGAAGRATLGTVDGITERVRGLGLDDQLRTGHSLARLRDDLRAGGPTGAEQLVSLEALMLRSIGIPARVVVGLRSTDTVIEAADLAAWVEVPFEDVGWVAFDPVPAEPETNADGGDDDQTPPSDSPDETVIPAQALPRELGPGEDPDEPDARVQDRFTRGEFALLAAGVIVLVVVALVAARVVRRRLRHRAGGRAEARTLGAWAELVDRLRELGAPISATTTVDDVAYMAELLDERLGAEARALGALASAALHGPGRPDPESGDAAWAHLHAAEEVIVQRRGRRITVLRYVDPRVLRYRAPVAPRERAPHRGGAATAVLEPPAGSGDDDGAGDAVDL